MKFALCLTLAACVVSPADLSAGSGYTLASSPSLLSTSSDGTIQKKRRGKTRRARHAVGRRKKNVQQPSTQDAPANGPVTDAPNRQEIDPGDIPPSERPRDPNVDDRTKIPEEISPDDKVPRPKKPE